MIPGRIELCIRIPDRPKKLEMAGEGLTSYNIAFPPQSPAAFLPDPNGRYVAQMYDAMCGWKTGECPKMLMSVEVLGVEISPCRSVRDGCRESAERPRIGLYEREIDMNRVEKF